jgi:hypothetical protein
MVAIRDLVRALTDASPTVTPRARSRLTTASTSATSSAKCTNPAGRCGVTGITSTNVFRFT